MGELCEVVAGSTPKTSVPEYWDGDIPWITPDDLSRHRTKRIGKGARSLTQAGYDSCSTRLVPEGSILYTTRAPIGYVAIADRPVCTNQGFKNFVPPPTVDSSYLYWYLRHATPEIREMGSGTTFIEVSKKVAQSIPVALPRLSEQRRIVEAIEEQFSRLDAAEESLTSGKARLGQARSVVLAAAFMSAPRLPLSELLVDLRYGTSVKCSVGADGPPVLRIPNVQSGEVVVDDLKWATKTLDVDANGVRVGDLLFVRTNGSRNLIGRVACVGNLKGYAYASYLIRARVDMGRVLPRFLSLVLSSPSSRRAIESKAATTAGQYNLNQAAIASLEVPLPSIRQQQAILQRAEQSLSVLGSVEVQIGRGMSQSAVLRRSLLREAFSGTLVA
jgi:type I restriction enzyme S subunit